MHLSLKKKNLFTAVLLGFLFVQKCESKSIYFDSKSKSIEHASNTLDENVIYPTKLYNLTVRNREELHIEIVLDNRAYVLELLPNKILLNKYATVEYSSKNSAKIEFLNRSTPIYCHFYGQILHDESSLAAVSICNGLEGFVHHKNKTYFIEPLMKSSYPSGRKKRSIESTLNYDFDSNPHLIYTHKSVRKSRFGPILKDIDQSKKQSIENKRQKRSISIERYMEVLLVADFSLYAHFQQINIDLESFLFTILNMVSTIFKHHSIGASIELNLVRMIIFDNETSLFSQNIEETLTSFCEYQNKINYPIEHEQHHDVAILVTQLDFADTDEEGGETETLGLARLGGMCDPESSCNVNQNNGLSLAFTIAHEIGHNFNADHDFDMGCTNDDSTWIMQTNLRYGTNAFEWSECSRTSIKEFLDTGHAQCLEDKPDINILSFNMSRALPGTFFDYDLQCKLRFGKNATHCPEIDEKCTKLWCLLDKTENKCHSANTVAEGTLCDTNNTDGFIKWCILGKCVLKNESSFMTESIDGGWSEWDAEWSQCSHECDGGVQYTKRYCNNPTPVHGGKFCLGEEARFRICNQHKCKEAIEPFKLHKEMCKSFENSTNWQHIIKPGEELSFIYNHVSPCKLICHAVKSNVYIDTMTKLPDGTKCSPFSNDICINGACRKLGCDLVLNSNASEDVCGVCNGDNSTCSTVNGSRTYFDLEVGYHFVAKIPTGSMNILVINDNSENFIAAKNASDFYIFNGDYVLNKNSIGYSDGIDFSYTSNQDLTNSNPKEKLLIKGPLPVDIIIELFYFRSMSKVEFEYSTAKNNNKTFHFRSEESNSVLDDLNYDLVDNATSNGSYWIAGEWSNTCDENPCINETRLVYCAHANMSRSNFGCVESEMPAQSRECQLHGDVICKSQVFKLLDFALNKFKEILKETFDF